MGILPEELPLDFTFAIEMSNFKYFPRAICYGHCDVVHTILRDMLVQYDIAKCNILESCGIEYYYTNNFLDNI